MYAFVIFEEDNISLIVPIEDIKFKGTSSVENYNSSKAYKVKYTDGQYYKAFIIAVGETSEVVKLKAEEKRIRLPSSKLRTNECETISSEDERVTPKKIVRSSKKEKIAYQKGNFNEIMNTFNAQNSDVVVHNASNSPSWKEKYKMLETEKQTLEAENCVLRDLNYKLQHEVIAQFKNWIESSPPPTATQVLEEKVTFDDVPVGGVHCGQVHIGRGVLLPAAVFNMAMAKKKDSIFVKELACSVFSPEVLSKSSVTGLPGNKTQQTAKPALDATKLLAIEDILQFRFSQRGEICDLKELRNVVHKNIRDKIQDLIRPPRDSKKTKCKPKVDTLSTVEEVPVHMLDKMTFENELISVVGTNKVLLVDEAGNEIGQL